MQKTTKKNEEILFFNRLIDQYQYMGHPIDTIDEKSEFTIHNLAGVHSNYKSPVYKTNFFSFVFVKDAEGEYMTDEHVFRTEPGTIYFTNPGHYKSYHWTRLKEAYLITLSESFLKENVHPAIFQEFPFLLAETVAPRVLQPEAFTEFEQLYLQIEKEYKGSSPYRNRLIGNLFVVLLLKIKEYFWEDYNPIYEGNRSSQIVKNFKRALEQHYRDLLNGRAEQVYRIQDYAALQNLHPNYLGNVIKSKTGKAVSTWISEKTVAEAKAMLQHTANSIKEIANKLGFAEAAHFSNYFRKHTDLSPAQYRKLHVNTDS